MSFNGFKSELKTENVDEIKKSEGKLEAGITAFKELVASLFNKEQQTENTESEPKIPNLEPRKEYVKDGEIIKTDDNGIIYEKSGEIIPNINYEIDGRKYKTDDLGNDYMKDGELIPNNTYKKDGHTYTTNENGDVILKDGEKVKKEEVAQVVQNKLDGCEREQEVKKELNKQYPEKEGYSVVPEQYLRDKDGNIVKDSVTGKARRIDFVVIKDGKVVDMIEVTSKTADKTDQTAKEQRIRDDGGNYVKDADGNLVKIPSTVQTRIERRD